MAVMVREIRLDEVPDVLKLLSQFDKPATALPSGEQQAIIFAQITNNKGAIMAAFDQESIIATCTLNMCASLNWSGRPYAMIENVIVDRLRRGQGIGKLVLNAAVEKAKRNGCYKVALMTGSKKPETLRFYERAGFKQSKTGFQIRFNA